MTDNEIRVLDNFPRMQRLSTILLSNNYIFRIGNLNNLLNVTTLILTNNKITNLNEIDKLQVLNKLQILSLIDNPVTTNIHYRLYVINKLTSLKLLDFQKIKLSEVNASKLLFNNTEGVQLLSKIQSEGSAATGHDDEMSASYMEDEGHSTSNSNKGRSGKVLTDDQKRQVRMAIESASTKEEMDMIETQLRVRTVLY